MKKLSQVNRQLFPEPLSKDDEAVYLRRFFEHGDNGAREMLISHNLRLVAHIAKKFMRNLDASFNLDDIISVGTLGLIKAVDSFRLGANVALATYSSTCIENEILMFLRKTKKHQGVVSLETPIKTDETGKTISICELLSSGIDFTEQVEIKVIIEKLKETISEKEWHAFELRFLKDYKQQTIADEMGASQSYVSRLNKRVVKILQENIFGPKTV